MRAMRNVDIAARWLAAIQPNDTITVAEAYEAMRTFLEAVWRRLDKSQEEMRSLS